MSQQQPAPALNDAELIERLWFGRGQRVKRDTLQAAGDRIANLGDALSKVRDLAAGALMADEHGRLDALKAIIRLTGRKAT
jgi:hypothetical protein